jgi:hypothetical protein
MAYIRQKDLAQYREDNRPEVCPIAGTSDFDPVVDHCHKSGFIRGVICREMNALLGRIENQYWRLSNGARKKSLPQMLRAMADYLENQPAKDVHPVGYRQLYKRFMYLPAHEQRKAIADAGGCFLKAIDCKNAAERQRYYKQVLKR